MGILSKATQRLNKLEDAAKKAVDAAVAAAKERDAARYTRASDKAFYPPVDEAKDVERQYKKQAGVHTGPGRMIDKVDIERAKRIADAYQAMPHEPMNPDVQRAYSALADETLAQYQALLDRGVNFDYFRGRGEPYKSSPEMADDLRQNRRLKVLATEGNYGQGPITEEDVLQNPMLRRTDYTDAEGNKLLVNDIFRAVHDYFGHSTRGTGFGPVGEENAWDAHWAMFSPEARRALTTETRGQNSWVNYGPHMRNPDGSIKRPGDEGYLPPTQRPFADQKIGLLPEEYVRSPYRPMVDDPRKVTALKRGGIATMLGTGAAAESEPDSRAAIEEMIRQVIADTEYRDSMR